MWEQPRYGYLHELLISKRGIPATIAVLLAHVMQRLLVRGAINFAVRTQLESFYDRWTLLRMPVCLDWDACEGLAHRQAQTLQISLSAFAALGQHSLAHSASLPACHESAGTPQQPAALHQAAAPAPRAEPISNLARLPELEVLPGLDRSMVLSPSGAPLNLCSWDALVQLLRFLKRAYWPAAWEVETEHQVRQLLLAWQPPHRIGVKVMAGLLSHHLLCFLKRALSAAAIWQPV